MKTHLLLYSLMMFRTSCCAEVGTLESKTVTNGDQVELTCPRDSVGTYFWIRHVSGGLPIILAQTGRLKEFKNRVEIIKKNRLAILYFSRAELSDSEVYYCVKTQNQNLIFVKGVHLQVNAGPVSEVPATTRPAPSDEPVTLRCSVLPGSQNQTCAADESVLCFHDESPPSLNSSNGSENKTHNVTETKCLYSHFKNFVHSDAQTYFCSLASCGEKTWGSQSKSDNEGGLKTNNVIVYLLSAALGTSLIIIAILVYVVLQPKKKSYQPCDDLTELQANPIVGSQQENEQTDTLVYSAVLFNRSEAEKKKTQSTEEDSIYSNIKTPKTELTT